MALATDNLAQTQQSYRRELNQSRRLPRFRPESSAASEVSNDDSDQTELDYDEQNRDSYDDDFEGGSSEEEAAEEEESEAIDQQEEEIEEEEELIAAEEEDSAGGGDSKEAVDRLKKEAVKKSKEAVTRLASRLKIAKIGAALTLVGLIVTYLIMTFQFIVGNWLANPDIPKLSFLEIIIWVLLTFVIILAVVLLFIVAIIAIALGLGPLVALGMFGQELIGIIF